MQVFELTGLGNDPLPPEGLSRCELKLAIDEDVLKRR